MDFVLERLLSLASNPSKETLSQDLYECLKSSTRALGFNLFSLGYQQGLPMSTPRFTWVSNYPDIWTERYLNAGYLTIDPRIERARQRQDMFLWCEGLFSNVPQMWEDLKKHDLHQGISFSVLDKQPGFSMLSLVRLGEPALCETEIHKIEHHIRCLARLSHDILRNMVCQQQAQNLPTLTEREVEVLKWTADGKSAQDIAEILEISKNTIDFHIKNSVRKLDAPNKTAAVIRAALSGLL